MKRLFLLLLALALVFPTALAQSVTNSILIDETTFRPVQTDALTGIAVDPIGLDRSKNPCSRIKMKVHRMTREDIGELSIAFRNATVQLMKRFVATEGNGLIFEMTAKKEVRFYLRHPKYGESNEVTLQIEPNKEYYIEASLNHLHTITVVANTPEVEIYLDDVYKGKTNSDFALIVQDVLPGDHLLRFVYGSSVVEQHINVQRDNVYFKGTVNVAGMKPQYVVFTVSPATAVVTLDGEIMPLDEGGSAFKTLTQGSYSYRVEAQDYHPESGTVVVRSERVSKNITLRPAFGWLKIGGTSVDGATIYVDNQRKGVAPLSEPIRLASGQHAVQIAKSKYKNYTTNVTISDNQTSTLTPTLAANFAVVSLTVAGDAEIWIDNDKKGVGSWRGELELGSHRVECRKAGHRTSEQSLAVETSAPITRTLTSPTPITGSLDVISSPLVAEVWVDGRKVGETPYTLSSILVGKHKVELRKSGYTAWAKEITVAEGQTVSLNATLTKQTAQTAQTSQTSTSSTSVNAFCEMVYVEGGTFTMGDTFGGGNSDERPTHSVTLSPFYIGKYEVTQAQWKSVMGNNPSNFKGDNLPVENVSWNDIQEFIRKLNAKTGKKYRLPTEAEWEYAARGGRKSQGYEYSGSNDIDAVAWYYYNSNDKTHPVGQKQPNELGIYDMTGSVWEWCADWRGSYSGWSQTNPTGPSSGSSRVLRGGCWYNYASRCRVLYRAGDDPSNRFNYCGFRLVLCP